MRVRREEYVRRKARGRSCGVAIVFGCLSFSISTAHAADVSCESGRPSLFDQVVTIADGREQRLQMSFAVPGRYLIAAQEQGIDVIVSLSMPQRMHLRFDSPMQRSGTQIALVTLQQPAAVELQITSKGHDAAGRVHVTAQVLSDECAKPLQLIADAHHHYGLAEARSRGVDLSATKDATDSYRRATELLRSALNAMDKSTSPRLQALTTYEMAMALYEGAKQWSPSEVAAQRAVAEFQVVGDEYGATLAKALQAAALMEVARSGGGNAGAVRPKLADAMAHARSLLTEAAATHAKRGEPYEQSLAENNIGLAYYYEGRADDAMAAYEVALARCRRIGERVLTALVLQNMAMVRLDRGQFSEAVTGFKSVLALLDPGEHPQLYGTVLQNSGLANAVSGRFDAALDRYSAALELWIKVQNPREEARSRNGLGYVYYLVGDYDEALALYEQALSQRTVAVDGPGRASTLRALGNLHRMFGRTELALKMHREAFALASTPIAHDTAFIQIARDYAAQGNHQRAIGILDEVLSGASDQLTRAHAKLERGRSRVALSENTSAQEDLRDALNIFQHNNLAAEQVECLIELARSTADRPAAVALLDQAIDLSDGLRAQTSNPELKATLTQPARAAVDFKVALLADRDQGMDDAALESLTATERARARVLAEIGASGGPGSDSEIVQQRERLYRMLSERRWEYERVANRYGNTDSRAVAALGQVSAAQAELDRLNRIRPVQQDHVRVQRFSDRRDWLPEDSCIAAYWLGDKDAYVWTLTRTDIHWRKLGDSASIDAQARELQTAFSGFRQLPATQRVRLATTLYDRLIRPLDEGCLSKGALYFVPDGPLHYVPFGALHSEDKYLIESHDVAVVPALSLLSQPPRSKRQPRMLLVSDPVFDSKDARLAGKADRSATVASVTPDSNGLKLRGRGDVSRLIGTAVEADEIAALWSRRELTRLSGFAATRSALLAAPIASFTHVHIATHGFFHASAPRLSSLLLSTYDADGGSIEGGVWAGDIAALRFDAELVTLSGCETALGRYVHGEGLMGLQYLVLGRGARSVIASSWSVPDRDAAALMSSFYRRLLTHSQSPSRALAQSMRELLRHDRDIDPAYWSAFSVMTTSLGTEE